MKSSKLSQQNIKQIIKLYQSNHKVSHIAKQFKVCTESIVYHLKKHEIYHRKQNYTFRKNINRTEILPDKLYKRFGLNHDKPIKMFKDYLEDERTRNNK